MKKVSKKWAIYFVVFLRNTKIFRDKKSKIYFIKIIQIFFMFENINGIRIKYKIDKCTDKDNKKNKRRDNNTVFYVFLPSPAKKFWRKQQKG